MFLPSTNNRIKITSPAIDLGSTMTNQAICYHTTMTPRTLLLRLLFRNWHSRRCGRVCCRDFVYLSNGCLEIRMMCILAIMNESIRIPSQCPHVVVSLLFLFRGQAGVGFPELRFMNLFDLVFCPSSVYAAWIFQNGSRDVFARWMRSFFLFRDLKKFRESAQHENPGQQKRQRNLRNTKRARPLGTDVSADASSASRSTLALGDTGSIRRLRRICQSQCVREQPVFFRWNERCADQPGEYRRVLRAHAVRDKTVAWCPHRVDSEWSALCQWSGSGGLGVHVLRTRRRDWVSPPAVVLNICRVEAEGGAEGSSTCCSLENFEIGLPCMQAPAQGARWLSYCGLLVL